MDQELAKNVNLSVRTPRDRAVKQRAVRARRSLNGGIIHRLEQSLMAEEAGTPRPPTPKHPPSAPLPPREGGVPSGRAPHCCVDSTSIIPSMRRPALQR
jgi:hypothetical protein